MVFCGRYSPFSLGANSRRQCSAEIGKAYEIYLFVTSCRIVGDDGRWEPGALRVALRALLQMLWHDLVADML